MLLRSASPARSSRASGIVLGTVAVAVCVGAALARVPLIGSGQIDFDEGVYWASLRSLSEGHPMFSAVYSSQPPAFLDYVLPFYSLLGHSLGGARIGIVVAWLIAVVAGYRIGLTLFGRGAGVAAALVLLCDPLMFRQSVAVMADGPAVAFGLVSVALAAQSRSAGRPRHALAALAGAALAVGVFTKLFDIAFAIPVAALCIGAAPRELWRDSAITAGWALAGAIVATTAVLVPYADRLPAVWAQIVGGHVSARTLDEGGASPELWTTVLRELPLLALGIAGIAAVARSNAWLSRVLAAWAIAGVALLLIQRPLWPHHLVIAVPPFAIATGALAERVLSGSAAVTRRAAFAALALAASVALIAAGVSGALATWRSAQAPADPATSRLLGSAVPANARVVSDDPFAVTLSGRDTPPELVDTSEVRLNSQPLRTADVVRLIERERVTAVLFATGRLSKLHGLQVWVASHFPTSVALGPGRTLYRR